MNVFLAGATGAIGEPLIAQLVRQGHRVTGLTRAPARAERLRAQGAKAVQVDIFDPPGLAAALREAQAEIVIDQLTALPLHQADMPAAAAGDRHLRLEGGGNLYRAAQTTGVRRYLQQASAFFHAPGPGLADETTPLAVAASPGVAANAQAYAQLEARVLQPGAMEGVALRYGFYYGPKTWYQPTGTAAEAVRRSQLAIIGAGQAVWSFVHIEDAAAATVACLTAPPGIYNLVDDDPVPVSTWLPAFSRFCGGPPPPSLTEEAALQALGADAVYYGTRLRGASNAKARAQLGFQPRRLEWLA